MKRLFDNANYDFMGVRKYAYLATAIVAVAGLIALIARGLSESIEFTGGTLLQVHATDARVTIGGIRSALSQAGIGGAELSTFGTSQDFLVRVAVRTEGAATEETEQETAAAVDAALSASLGQGSYTLGRTWTVGPKVGGELRRKALIAVLLSFGATLIYLTFRFEWRFGIAATLATAHDIVLTTAFIALMHLEISLLVIAAVLTIVGYSLNDTIIVFDRVRENLHKYKRQDLYGILNRSVNETLPRTTLTAGTTVAATVALLVFGGAVIRDFAWIMTFGITTGTFSSIYIASPVLMWIERRWPGEDVHGTRALPQAGVPQVS